MKCTVTMMNEKQYDVKGVEDTYISDGMYTVHGMDGVILCFPIANTESIMETDHDTDES